MKKTQIVTSIPLLFFWILLLFSCSTTFGQIKSSAYEALLKTLYKEKVPLISCKDAHSTDAALFLDTRSYEEYKVSHIPGARWVGYEEFTLDRVKNVSRKMPLIVYCSVGVRSEKIGKELLDAGFVNVRNLYGSLFEWVNQGYPIVDITKKPTEKVHAYSRIWGIWLQKGEKVYE
jgi:rhodanese-related sulfurtransferase